MQQRHYRYVMRDQVRDRVASIMDHPLRRAAAAGGLDRSVWLLLAAIAAAYTAALTLSGPASG
ncbi:MAG: hypothetical protein MUF66_02340 [Gammaproteobacteria bacterium]|jgi:hypothetical protein|nr:hypothetical protein [Gammaproteobacteria bacterium]